MNAQTAKRFTVIGRCQSPDGKDTAFVLNSVPADTEFMAARAAIAEMHLRGAVNVRPHKSRRTDVGV